MITIGVDAHKEVHVAEAVDDLGRPVGRIEVSSAPRGWKKLFGWATRLGTDRMWGVEGAWSYGRGLAQHLVSLGERVYDINPRWTAQGRRRGRKTDKNDSLDARAIALWTLREAPTLPRVTRDDSTAEVNLLVVERDGALADATRLRNQIHSLLMQLDPEYKKWLPRLQSKAGSASLKGYRTVSSEPLQQRRAASVRRLAERLCLALEQAKELEQQIQGEVEARFAPLMSVRGIGSLTAGALAGILGPGRRFASDSQLAAYAGAAPLEASSAGKTRHRLNRGGNRRLNAILYRIVLTQSRHSEPARAYLERKLSEGKTLREARRSLKRYVVRAIWQAWQTCPRPPDVRTGASAPA